MDQASTAKTATDRRSFLKSGAIAAAPLAMAAPAAVLADDGSRARLARLEDEKRIAALHRDLVRQVNRGERKLAEGLTSLADDPAHELQITFADDGRRASCRRACRASFRTEFTGHSTLEQMHRLQGQGVHSHEESRVLVAEYVKRKDGWAVASLRLA
ncbi:MAG: hypothetical protein J2O44_02975 [Porphyrobacter sp.]|nr:hypothetical protein [Porphyrobacter sp.]